MAVQILTTRFVKTGDSSVGHLRIGCIRVVAALASAALAAGHGYAQPAETKTVVLDGRSFWRIHHTLKPPVIQTDGVSKTIQSDYKWLNWETPQPADGWTRADFDDSAWLSGPFSRHCKTPYLAQLCMRGYFTVADPAKVMGLSLSVGYHGGAVVYLNGKEIARGDVQPTKSPKPVLAKPYPKEAFVTQDGKLITWQLWREASEDEKKRLGSVRRRELTAAIKPALVRSGINVIAVEVVQAAYDRVAEEQKLTETKEITARRTPYELNWNTCEAIDIRLSAANAEGIQSSLSRPAGLQVWNGDILVADSTGEFGNPAEPLRPARIIGVPNGEFSVKVMVGSPKAIKGRKVTAADFTAGSAKIPASNVRVRYGVPWAMNMYSGYYRPKGMDILLKSAPPELPVSATGTAVAVWVTVRVPKDAKPGTYQSRLTIQADGSKPVTAPVQLSVGEWPLPDTQDWRTWVELIQSPDTLAIEYDLPQYSDRHWKMIARSFEYMGDVGSRVLHIPLLCHTNFGNEQSMVRWIRKSDGTYDFDFSIAEKYLDLAVKHMGKPKIVAFMVWDSFLRQRNEKAPSRGVPVTLLDPKTGKTDVLWLPYHTDPAVKEPWRRLLDGLRRRLAARGIEDTMMLSLLEDWWPSKEEVAFFNGIAPGVPWVKHSHRGIVGYGRSSIYEISRIGYEANVWNLQYNPDPWKKRTYGWKRPELVAEFDRNVLINYWPGTTMMCLAEFNITGLQRGVGRIGADWWWAIGDKRGQRRGTVTERYPKSLYHNLNIRSCVLAPGPDGPVATSRYENFRAGVQQCEARIFLERALTDEAMRQKLGADLAKRCRELLDERVLYMWKGGSELQLTGRKATDFATNVNDKATTFSRHIGGAVGHRWFVGSGWQKRSEELYSLAGAVASRLGAAGAGVASDGTGRRQPGERP